jgi:pimeloyl-ACP methyl ester carboxylesterase
VAALERTIDGVGYRVTGSGEKAIVLLRGLARWSDHWLGFDEQLAAHGVKVIAIDNRGFGRSAQLTVKNLDIAQMAEDVAAVITKEAPGGAHIVSVSLGGMIAMSLAAFKPQLVRSLIIVNSSVASSKLQRISRRALLSIGSIVARSNKGYGKLANSILGQNTSSIRKAELAERWKKIDFAASMKLKNLWSQLMAARNFGGLSEMAAIRCPVTVIKGNSDAFVDPKNSDFIQKNIKGAQLLTHPSAGHEIVFDDPEWMIKRIMEHIDACS